MSRVEVWHPISGWEGSYEVSNRGRVRSLDRTIMRACRHPDCTRRHPMRLQGRILAPSWRSVVLYRGGRAVTYTPEGTA